MRARRRRASIAGIVNNVPATSTAGTLTGFYGELGGELTYTPTHLNAVLESRYFDAGVKYNAFSTAVQDSDPGTFSLEKWKIK